MQFTDEAIVLSSSKYGENSGIVCIFTENHGIYKGLVRGISGARQRGMFQMGNIIESTWRARLAEHLGQISASIISPGAVTIMNEPLKLAALASLCALLEVSLQEREKTAIIYKYFKEFVIKLQQNGENWQQSYILLELNLLEQLGFGLDLTSCAATETTEELIYVSPKSGRAVCRQAGLPYQNKLLKLPAFILGQPDNSNMGQQIYDGIKLCSYFLDKYFFLPHNIRAPHARLRFVAMLQNQNDTNKQRFFVIGNN